MNLLAINGSARKGKSTDTLIDRAMEGVRSGLPTCRLKKIHLIDHHIQFCKNCMACRDSRTNDPVAGCTIRDDMDHIKTYLLNADLLILGTPVHMGYASAIMMSFLERICWTFAKPGRKVLGISGCPLPRSDKTRQAAIIVTSGIVPPVYRKLCDWATGQMKGVVKDSLNGKIVGDLYAGDIEHRGVDHYLDKAYRLGQRLV